MGSESRILGSTPPGLLVALHPSLQGLRRHTRTLEQLQRQKIKLGVITNGKTQWQQQKLDSLGLTPLFDTVLISEAEGLRKPDRAIFERALERLSVRAGDAMFVGDNPEADVAGSRTAGLVPVWKYVPYWKMNLKDVLTVHKLVEILPHCLKGT